MGTNQIRSVKILVSLLFVFSLTLSLSIFAQNEPLEPEPVEPEVPFFDLSAGGEPAESIEPEMIPPVIVIPPSPPSPQELDLLLSQRVNNVFAVCTLAGTDYAIVTTVAELQDALECANTDQVTLPYEIYLDSTSSFILTAPLLVDRAVEIYGRGLDISKFDGNSLISHLFFVTSAGSLKLYNVTLQEGQGGFSGYGGGIFAYGDVEIYDSKLTNNHAQYGGGAIIAYDGLTIKRSVFTDNGNVPGAAIRSVFGANVYVECTSFSTNTGDPATLYHDGGNPATLDNNAIANNGTPREIYSDPASIDASKNWWNGRTPSTLVNSTVNVSSPLSSDPAINNPDCELHSPVPLPPASAILNISTSVEIGGVPAETDINGSFLVRIGKNPILSLS